MQPSWREVYQRMAGHPDFRNLRKEGPIAARIAFLEKQLKDTRITDPVENTAIKNELHGIEFVFEIVENLPAEEAPAQPKSARFRRTVQAWKDSLLLPRPLG
jgi:hypothetical protein